jgi:hypothetical protein
LTTQKFLPAFPKFEVGHIHSRARCVTRRGLVPSVADRVKILTGSFPEDAHLKAWAARNMAAVDLHRGGRPAAER